MERVKRGAKLFSLGLFSILMINLVSAFDFRMSELLSQIDQSVVVLVVTFIVSFALIFFALKQSILKKDPGIAGIVAAMIALLITYSLNKVGLESTDLDTWVANIGISESSLGVFLLVAIIAGIIYLIVHFAKNSLFIIGGALIVLAFFAYQKATLIFFGAVILAIRIFAIKPDKWNPKPKTPKTP